MNSSAGFPNQPQKMLQRQSLTPLGTPNIKVPPQMIKSQRGPLIPKVVAKEQPPIVQKSEAQLKSFLDQSMKSLSDRGTP